MRIGNLHEVTHSKYVPLMESKDRTLRKNAFNSMYNNYKNSEQSTTEIYLSEVKFENEIIYSFLLCLKQLKKFYIIGGLRR